MTDTYRRVFHRSPSATGAMSPRSLWLSFDRVRHRVIVRTVAGGAPYVAHRIDAAASPDVLGTIAGDDSVIVACISEEAAVTFTVHLNDFLLPKEDQGPK